MNVTAARSLAGVFALMLSSIAVAQTVATIDGVEITQEDLDVFALGRTGSLASEENKAQLIDQLGDLIILSNAAVKAKLDQQPATQAAVELQRRSALAQATINNFLDTNTITDEELKAEYDRQIGGQPKPEQYKARHILLETKEEAQAVIEELKGGADFAELAKARSTGPSGPQGGDLGWFDASAMVEPFSVAVVGMQNGQYSEIPVQTQFGWHVILREDSRQTELPGFEEVKDRIRDAMSQQQFQAYFQELKALAKVEIAE
ncbi:MAG: peptidylprolyl isomerase [Pseudomonadota bacterium]